LGRYHRPPFGKKRLCSRTGGGFSSLVQMGVIAEGAVQDFHRNGAPEMASTVQCDKPGVEQLAVGAGRYSATCERKMGSSAGGMDLI
jgi:hypothetical protein